MATYEREEDGVFHIWDLSGAETFQTKWKYFFTDVRAVIFVIDAADGEKFDKIKEKIISLHNDEELAKASFLFLLNKFDSPGAWSTEDVVKILGLKKLYRRAWKIIETIAASGHGLSEGIDWLWVDVNTHPDDKTYVEEDPEPEVLPEGEENGLGFIQGENDDGQAHEGQIQEGEENHAEERADGEGVEEGSE